MFFIHLVRSPHRQPVLHVLGAARALAQQQNPADRLQGGVAGGRGRRHDSLNKSGKRWELERRAAQQFGGDEEPSGQIQRSAIRRSEWAW